MTRLNLCKYGFIRWPEEDFSDDGNRFTCYRAGKKIRVSKLVSNGQVYLSASSDAGNGTLPYEVYSKLPHYHDSNWKWNGVSLAGLTDQDVKDFYTACILYEMEYEDTESRIEYPTECELLAKCIRIQNKLLREMNELETLLGEHAVEAAVKFSKWEWEQLQKYLTHMLEDLSKYKPDTFIPNVLGTARSFTFLQNKEDTEPTYWYKSIKEVFDKYGLSSI